MKTFCHSCGSSWRQEICRTDDLVELLTPLMGEGVARVRIEQVRAGASALAGCLQSVLGHHRVAVVDGETDRDLEIAAAAGVALARESATVVVGSYGLAHFVGKLIRSAQPILVASGSVKESTLEQISAAAESGVTVVEVPLPFHEDRNASLVRCASELRQVLESGRDTILATATPASAIHLDTRQGIQMLQGLFTVVSSLSPALYAGLIVIGGETAGGVFNGLNVRRLVVDREPWPATPLMTALGDRKMPVILKSGSWGNPSWILDALKILHLEVDHICRIGRPNG
jgi:uncharacterized protein YgbK (DUF1537 family)